MGTIKMTLRVGDGKNGGKVELHARLLGEGGLSVDCGNEIVMADVRNKILPDNYAKKGERCLFINYEYPRKCKKNGDKFEMTISTENDNIVYFWAAHGGIIIENLDISGCQELEELEMSYGVQSIDISKNPRLRSIQAYGDSGNSMDFSESRQLEYLALEDSKKKCLNLLNCAKLDALSLSGNNELEMVDLSGCPMITQMEIVDNHLLRNVKLHKGCQLKRIYLKGCFSEETKDSIRAACDDIRFLDESDNKMKMW